MNAYRQDKGAVLVAVMILAVIISIFCVASLVMSGAESQGTAASILRDRALFVASSGIEDQLNDFNQTMADADISDPFENFDLLGGTTPISLQPLISDGVSVGQYTVKIDSVTTVDGYTRDIQVSSTGWVPSAADPKAVSRKVTAVVRIGTGRSKVFDYVYFINNWGWYYGNTIIANGNVRANGQFDMGGYAPTVNRLPRYDTLSAGGQFQNQLDNGGAYSGWSVANSDSVQGTSAGTQNMHSFGDQLPMPNLTDLSSYETKAKANNSNVKINGTVMCDAVVGDKGGEKPDLYLDGTTNAITLNGPVVVRGNLIIKGKVTGKGCFYVAGNIYVAGNLTYVNAVTATPTATDVTTMQNWVSTNSSKDALGLFARKHIIVGDYTDSTWQSKVGKWVTDPRNNSDEDAGTDGIPNTKAGRDGILGTADDDVLENNDVFDVSTYTQADKDAKRIPKKKKVGDAIPGTGEDIDGDGAYTPPVKVSDFTCPTTLTAGNWTGNFPSGGNKAYSSLCTNGETINRLDAAFYTNHSFAMYTDASGDLVFNGCLVARNEDIVYGTDHCIFNYDMRLLQDSSPFCLSLPRTWKPLQMVMWKSN